MYTFYFLGIAGVRLAYKKDIYHCSVTRGPVVVPLWRGYWAKNKKNSAKY